MTRQMVGLLRSNPGLPPCSPAGAGEDVETEESVVFAPAESIDRVRKRKEEKAIVFQNNIASILKSTKTKEIVNKPQRNKN